MERGELSIHLACPVGRGVDGTARLVQAMSDHAEQMCPNPFALPFSQNADVLG
jgi:hypothetical protein